MLTVQLPTGFYRSTGASEEKVLLKQHGVCSLLWWLSKQGSVFFILMLRVQAWAQMPEM